MPLLLDQKSSGDLPYQFRYIVILVGNSFYVSFISLDTVSYIIYHSLCVTIKIYPRLV